MHIYFANVCYYAINSVKFMWIFPLYDTDVCGKIIVFPENTEKNYPQPLTSIKLTSLSSFIMCIHNDKYLFFASDFSRTLLPFMITHVINAIFSYLQNLSVCSPVRLFM